MKNQKETIRKIVGFLNNPEYDGGFWLPNIQRPFVWTEEQICRLFDSILREYPISTLLVWKTQSKIQLRKFIDNWKSSVRLTDFHVPKDDSKKYLVLDGQQRLQSLYIGLRGSYEGKELCFDVLSGDAAAPDDVRYKFKFMEPGSAVFPWVKFKDIIYDSRRLPRERVEAIKVSAGRPLSTAEADRLSDHIALVEKTFKVDEGIAYQELDSIDTPGLYSEDDVVEIFIRANSGGTKLGKSDLLFSLLSSTWETADSNMEDLLESLNRHGFDFDRDFVLKAALTVLGQGAKYEVEKFRKDGVRPAVEANWEAISAAIMYVLDFVRCKTYIRCDKALPSYLVLIPLIYIRYHFPEAWRSPKGVDSYLLKCLLGGAFGGNSDYLIDELVKKSVILKGFDASALADVIKAQGRSLEVTEDKLWDMGYSSGLIHLLFNLWYKDFNHTPAYDRNLPQIDHIFPQSVLKKVKTINSATGRQIIKYGISERNQLANCMLLSMEENGAGGKSDTLPEDWFTDKNEDYLNMHLIPKDKVLWKLEHFEDFIEARKNLIRAKFSHMLLSR